MRRGYAQRSEVRWDVYYATTQAVLCLCHMRRGSLVSTVLLSQQCSTKLFVLFRFQQCHIHSTDCPQCPGTDHGNTVLQFRLAVSHPFYKRPTKPLVQTTVISITIQTGSVTSIQLTAHKAPGTDHGNQYYNSLWRWDTICWWCERAGLYTELCLGGEPSLP